MEKKVGRFVVLSQQPYPAWVSIRDTERDVEISFLRYEDVVDLQYALERIKCEIAKYEESGNGPRGED